MDSYCIWNVRSLAYDQLTTAALDCCNLNFNSVTDGFHKGSATAIIYSPCQCPVKEPIPLLLRLQNSPFSRSQKYFPSLTLQCNIFSFSQKNYNIGIFPHKKKENIEKVQNLGRYTVYGLSIFFVAYTLRSIYYYNVLIEKELFEFLKAKVQTVFLLNNKLPPHLSHLMQVTQYQWGNLHLKFSLIQAVT